MPKRFLLTMPLALAGPLSAPCTQITRRIVLRSGSAQQLKQALSG